MQTRNFRLKKNPLKGKFKKHYCIIQVLIGNNIFTHQNLLVLKYQIVFYNT